MKDPFFQLNDSVSIATIDTEGDFFSFLDKNNNISNVMYFPEEMKERKISSVKFENVSFSKTSIIDVTFENCHFKDCLFISSSFDSVRFHGCEFVKCNFFRAKFNSLCYGKPAQFKRAICDKKYSNIAVSLFNELRLIYKEESQKLYKAEAEYYFNKWLYIHDYNKIKEGDVWFYFYPKKFFRKLYGVLFGYGYRLRNLVVTTTSVFISLVFLNWWCGDVLFDGNGISSLSQSIYFTTTTMLTLGASGFGEPTNIGRWLIILNVTVGISILSLTISTLFNRIVK